MVIFATTILMSCYNSVVIVHVDYRSRKWKDRKYFG